MAFGLEPRTGHPYYMYDMMQGQPEAVRAALNRNQKDVEALAELMISRRRIHIAGIGTSYHAAKIGEYFIKLLTMNRVDVRGIHSFEFANYGDISKEDVLVVISHRGTKGYSIRALKKAQERNAATVALTGVSGGEEMSTADHTLQTSEQEKSATFTVSYTTALSVLALMALEIAKKLGTGQVQNFEKTLYNLPELVKAALDTEARVKKLAEIYAQRRRFIFGAGGPNAFTAFEAALKMKESNYSYAEGIHIEQLLHGPGPSLDEENVITVIAPQGPSYNRTIEALRMTREIGCESIALVEEGDEEAVRNANHSVFTPKVPEILSPIVFVVPLQLLSYYISLQRRTNPDIFRRDNPKYKRALEVYKL